MPKLNFSGNLPNTIRNNILKLPVIPAGAFSNIQDGVQDGRQNVNTTISTGRYTTSSHQKIDERFITIFCPTRHIVNDSRSKSDL